MTVADEARVRPRMQALSLDDAEPVGMKKPPDKGSWFENGVFRVQLHEQVVSNMSENAEWKRYYPPTTEDDWTSFRPAGQNLTHPNPHWLRLEEGATPRPDSREDAERPFIEWLTANDDPDNLQMPAMLAELARTQRTWQVLFDGVQQIKYRKKGADLGLPPGWIQYVKRTSLPGPTSKKTYTTDDDLKGWTGHEIKFVGPRYADWPTPDAEPLANYSVRVESRKKDAWMRFLGWISSGAVGVASARAQVAKRGPVAQAQAAEQAKRVATERAEASERIKREKKERQERLLRLQREDDAAEQERMRAEDEANNKLIDEILSFDQELPPRAQREEPATGAVEEDADVDRLLDELLPTTAPAVLYEGDAAVSTDDDKRARDFVNSPRMDEMISDIVRSVNRKATKRKFIRRELERREDLPKGSLDPYWRAIYTALDNVLVELKKEAANAAAAAAESEPPAAAMAEEEEEPRAVVAWAAAAAEEADYDFQF